MNFEKLDRFFDYVEMFDLKGSDLAVYRNHEEVYRRKYGFRDAAMTEPVTENDIYWLYSMTKPITATAVLRLVERGELSMDDEVAKYLPEFAEVTVRDGETVRPAKTKMLIRHLFCMRSGMDYDLCSPPLAEVKKNKNATTREVVAAMAKQPLLFDPGENYAYGLSLDVLAAVAEVITGKTYLQFLTDELFEPLGIKNMGFHPTDEQRKSFTQRWMYLPDINRVKAADYINLPPYCLTEKFESGGAGLFATLDDYIKILDALACGGVAKNGYRVLKPETVELMRTNMQHDGCLLCAHKQGYGYGCGVRVMLDPAADKSRGPIGEFGWDGAEASYNFVDPEKNIAVVFTTQTACYGPAYFMMHAEIRNLVYDAL